ncbi:FAD-dependent oxidoreductase [Escherichia coli]
MSDDKFDAIVVGAGVAGSVAALVMARAGLDVLVIERGYSAGCKNMTGGLFTPTHLKQSFQALQYQRR